MSVLDKDTGQSLFPGWPQLLRNAAVLLEQENKSTAAKAIHASLDYIEKDSYLRAANIAKKELGKQQWNGFLKQQCDRPKSQSDATSLGIAEAIWQLVIVQKQTSLFLSGGSCV